MREQHSYMNNTKTEDQHHTGSGNNEISDSNGQSSTVPIVNEINELKKVLEREKKKTRFFNLQVNYDKRNLQGLQKLKNALFRAKEVPSHHTKTPSTSLSSDLLQKHASKSRHRE